MYLFIYFLPLTKNKTLPFTDLTVTYAFTSCSCTSGSQLLLLPVVTSVSECYLFLFTRCVY